MEERNWKLYKHTFPDGKVYIGITGDAPEKRWANGQGYSRAEKMSDAIRRCGWGNVKHDILLDGLTKKEAEKAEQEEIVKYKPQYILNTMYVKKSEKWLRYEGKCVELSNAAVKRLRALFGTYSFTAFAYSEKVVIYCAKVNDEVFATFVITAKCNCNEMSEEEFCDWMDSNFEFTVSQIGIQTRAEFDSEMERLKNCMAEAV